MYKQGSKDKDMVKAIQEVVGVSPDGDFGPKTERAIKAYQSVKGLTADGIVGTKTLEIMGLLDTDVQSQFYTTNSGLTIHKHFLPKGEYLSGPVKNEYAFLHHTAGWNNPYKCIDSWGRDDRGRICTEFVLGGLKISNGDDEYDGVMVQAFPEGGQGYHLGKTGSQHMNKHSVGLEICNFGYLKDGKTYVGTQAISDQSVTLNHPFRGYDEWHRYSDKQIEATKQWILFIAERDNIDVREGLVRWIKDLGADLAFEFQDAAYRGEVKGLLTHTNVRKDKSDCFPQQEMIDMLLSL